MIKAGQGVKVSDSLSAATDAFPANSAPTLFCKTRLSLGKKERACASHDPAVAPPIMVKLIVIARCIPEDVYLAHGDQLPAVAGKKFSVVVREPESWYIGRLAVEIQYRYEALYRR